MNDPIQTAIEKAEEAVIRLVEAADDEEACDVEVAEAEKNLYTAIRSLAATSIEEAAKAAEEGWSMKLNDEEVPSPAAARIRALLPESREEKP